MVKYFYNSENLRALAKKVPKICYIIACAGLLLTTIIHFSMGGDFGNILDYALVYIIACLIVAALGRLPIPKLLSKFADKIDKVQTQYATIIATNYEKLLSSIDSNAELTEELEAMLYAKAIQTTLLKAPATAQFCELNEMSINKTVEQYTVSGYVNAQNSYGALIRTPFVFNISKKDNQWKCSLFR